MNTGHLYTSSVALTVYLSSSSMVNTKSSHSTAVRTLRKPQLL